MKLIDYPFCHVHSPIYCEQRNSFRVNLSLDSKAIHSTEKSKYKTFILLEIDDKSIEIKGSTNSVFEYGIVDFYVPPKSGSSEYFSNFYNVLMNNDDYDIKKRSEDVVEPNEISFDGMNLFYPPPDISFAKPFTLLPGLNLSNRNEQRLNQIVKFDWESDDVPLNPVPEYKEKMSKHQLYDKAISFLNHLLSEQSIISKAELSKKRALIESLGMTQTCILNHLPIVAYYSAYGPWLKCWIKFGYDARRDYKNYVFQRLSKFRIKLNFLYEDKELLKIVEKNEDKFIKKDWDKETGFMKRDLIRFIKRRERGKNIDYLVGNN